MHLHYFNSPGYTLFIAIAFPIVGIALSTVAMLLLHGPAEAFRDRRRNKRQVVITSRRLCPRCGGVSLVTHSKGLWDGFTAEGKLCFGVYSLMSCDDCGARLRITTSSTWSNDDPLSRDRVAVHHGESCSELTFEQWQRESGRMFPDA